MLAGSAAAVTELTSACKPSTVLNAPKLGFTFCTLGLAPLPVYLPGLGMAPTNVVTEALSKPPTAGWLGPGVFRQRAAFDAHNCGAPPLRLLVFYSFSEF
jgi:hypothetical protein